MDKVKVQVLLGIHETGGAKESSPHPHPNPPPPLKDFQEA